MRLVDRLVKPRAQLWLALLWLLFVLGLAWLVQSRLTVSGDLRLFMPTPKTSEQKFLIEQLGEGPGSRVLLLAIEGAPGERLAELSRGLRDALAHDAAFRYIGNGEDTLDAIPERLRAYRYLLSPTLDTHRFDAPYLHAQLQQRLQDLGSPAAAMIEPLVPSDPTLETLTLAERWQPPREPNKIDGLWFSPDGKRALLFVETRAAGFDPQGQQTAVQDLQDAFAKLVGTDKAPARLTISGPGAFSVLISNRTQYEATIIGIVDTVSLLLLLLIAYRSPRILLLAPLPLATAGLAGLAAVSLAFGSVHGITLAFGFTLIGVVQDYPVHLFSHQHPGLSPWKNVRTLWPTLATGVISTCIAYLTFLISGVVGLQQLSVFTIVGLAAAAICTRWMLPALIDPDPRDVASSPLLGRLWNRIDALPQPRWPLLAGISLVALAVLVWAPAQLWENNLAALTPVPKKLLDRDQQLRSELGAPDVRYLLTMEAADADTVLAREATLVPELDALVARKAIDGYDLASRYLPSAAVQHARQQRLPDDTTLSTMLSEATRDLDFKPDVFAPFLHDVATARTLPPLRARDLADTPLALRLQSLLQTTSDRRARGLISLTGVNDTMPLVQLATRHPGELQLLDLKQASESLVTAYRERVLYTLCIALVLLAGAVWFALRSTHRVLKALTPLLISTLLILALFHACGVALSLFHLIALILAAGLGLDYALFFEHAGEDRDDQLRTLHAVLISAASTGLVFGLLGTSSIPVLRAIGLTVALGVVFNFVLALLISREKSAPGQVSDGVR
jgi:predicted exporter